MFNSKSNLVGPLNKDWIAVQTLTARWRTSLNKDKHFPSKTGDSEDVHTNRMSTSEPFNHKSVEYTVYWFCFCYIDGRIKKIAAVLFGSFLFHQEQ